MFLRTYITSRPTSSNFENSQLSPLDLDENVVHENSGNSAEPAASSEPNTKKRPPKRKVLSQTSEIREITDILSESIALQKQEKAEDRMGNKAFLMSLLPLMDNMPQNQLIAVRCKIMEVLQSFSFAQTTPSYTAENQFHTSYGNPPFRSVWEAPNQAMYTYSLSQTSQQSLYSRQRPTSLIPTSTPSPGQYLASTSSNSEETQMSDASSLMDLI